MIKERRIHCTVERGGIRTGGEKKEVSKGVKSSVNYCEEQMRMCLAGHQPSVKEAGQQQVLGLEKAQALQGTFTRECWLGGAAVCRRRLAGVWVNVDPPLPAPLAQHVPLWAAHATAELALLPHEPRIVLALQQASGLGRDVCDTGAPVGGGHSES